MSWMENMIKEEFKMGEYSKEAIQTFLEQQKKLFRENVADTPEEAEWFLEDCLAVEVNSIKEVRRYFEENGMDIDGMTLEDLKEAAEVFSLPNGKFLIVEG